MQVLMQVMNDATITRTLECTPASAVGLHPRRGGSVRIVQKRGAGPLPERPGSPHRPEVTTWGDRCAQGDTREGLT